MKVTWYRIHDYRTNVTSVPLNGRVENTRPVCRELNFTGQVWSLRLFLAKWPGLSLWRNQVQQLRLNYPAT